MFTEGALGGGRPSRPRPECAVFYVADPEFLMPSVVSAASLRRWITPADADVHIVTIGVEEAVLARVSAATSALGVAFWPLDPARVSGFDPAKFRKTHVSTSALGRFLMVGCVPARYDRLVYLDGDTWIARDPSPLIRHRPEPGQLLAGEDISFFFRNHDGPMGRRVRAYFAGLGIDGDHGYFNSGVLAARTDAWEQIASKAFRYFLSNTERCLYHDQSALNVVAQGCRVRLPPDWNFTPHYSQWGFERLVTPTIYHFAGGHKPWMGRFVHFPSWGRRYRETMREFQDLPLPLSRISGRERLKVNLRKRIYMALLRTVLARRQERRRNDFQELLRTAVNLGGPVGTPPLVEVAGAA